MLDRLAAAGAEGVTAADLVAGFNLDPDHRAVAVRRQLEIEQPNVATEWVPRPDAIGGRECIFRLTDPMSDTNETIQRT
ncbi:hypothetical protein BJF87_04040 [Gordonia sp. CNJ-863]|uniref:hypothetical protein n=1 Tax=Gordonia sp. CNJ-863 TaxID=1904963 RepID=UPI00095D9EEB|nr:hypothetical protein [Gordonia sp. CNJ-863]OLT47422.1 hypothetical protein BJF87_04040 [Gordonia sp. CNJ-863]